MRRSLTPDETYGAAIAFKRQLSDCLTLEQPGISVPQLAEQLHVRSERAYKWLDPSCPSNNFPGFLLPTWHEVIGPRLLQQIAYNSGCEVALAHPPLTTRRDVAVVLSEAMMSLATITRVIAPYIQGGCPAMAQRDARDEVLTLIDRARQIDRWAQAA